MYQYLSYRVKYLRYHFIELLGLNASPWVLKIINKLVPKFFPRYFIKKQCIFIHVPKVAGTSIASSLYGRSITHHPAIMFYRCDKTLYNSLYKFCVLRGPVDRFLSAYNFAFSGGTEVVTVNQKIVKIVRSYAGVEEFIEDFVNNNLPSEIYKDPIFEKQSYYITDEKKRLLVDDIIKLENLHKLENVLSEKGVYLEPIAKVNVTNRKADNKLKLHSSTERKINLWYEDDLRLYEKAL